MEEQVEAEQLKLSTCLLPVFIYKTLSLKENSENYTLKLYKVHCHPQRHHVCHTFSTLAFSLDVYTQMSVFTFSQLLTFIFKNKKCLFSQNI